MSIIYIKTLYMESFLTACQLFKWSHFFVKFGFTAPVFLIPGSCDRFPGQKTPVPGRKNRFPDFWIWSAISSGFWRFSPGTDRFPVPGLRRENASRRKRKPCFHPGFTIPLGNRRKPGFFPVPGTGRDWKPPGFPGKFRPNLNFSKKFVWTVTAASRAGTVVSRPVSVDFYREMPSAEGKIKNFGNISP